MYFEGARTLKVLLGLTLAIEPREPGTMRSPLRASDTRILSG